MCVRGAPLQDRHALHVLLHAIEEVVHVSFVRQAEAPALALQEPLVGFGAQHIARGLDPPRWSVRAILQAPSWRRLVWVWVKGQCKDCLTLPLIWVFGGSGRYTIPYTTLPPLS